MGLKWCDSNQNKYVKHKLNKINTDSNPVKNHELNQAEKDESNKVINRELNQFGNGDQLKNADADDSARVG